MRSIDIGYFIIIDYPKKRKNAATELKHEIIKHHNKSKGSMKLCASLRNITSPDMLLYQDFSFHLIMIAITSWETANFSSFSLSFHCSYSSMGQVCILQQLALQMRYLWSCSLWETIESGCNIVYQCYLELWGHWIL